MADEVAEPADTLSTPLPSPGDDAVAAVQAPMGPRVLAARPSRERSPRRTSVARPTSAPAPSPPAFELNQAVLGTGLASRPELNGQRGVITGYDLGSKRYLVRFPSVLDPVRVKPENLQRSIFDQPPSA